MFAVAVELLSGRYAATVYNDRDRAEWPPHPARFFSALVGAWAEGDPEASDGRDEERFLRWLEIQDAPVILADAVADASPRQVAPVFVPVNDVTVLSHPSREKLDEAELAATSAPAEKERKKADKEVAKLREKLLKDTEKAVAVPAKFSDTDRQAAEALLPDRRTKQPRTFPVVTPRQPWFAFVWSAAALPPELQAGAERLLARLVRLGHSSSQVRAIVPSPARLSTIEASTERYAADEERGRMVVRWVAPGQVDRLAAAFERHRETEPRVLPARFVPYREGADDESAPVPRSSFEDDLVVLAQVSGPRLPMESSAGVANQLRRALIAAADQPVHPAVSGHTPDGGVTREPHLAIAPLPLVMGPHPDGAILGIALVLPRSLDGDARRGVVRAVGRLERAGQRSPEDDAAIRLHLGAAGTITLRRVEWGEDPRRTLQPWTWTRPSRTWASATPVALDRNPGELHDRDPKRRSAAHAASEVLLRNAIERIGLPDPAAVDVVRSSVLPGSADSHRYPRFPAAAHKVQRVLVHVRVRFREPVRGPVLLGAGRFLGLGLLLPVDEPGRERGRAATTQREVSR